MVEAYAIKEILLMVCLVLLALGVGYVKGRAHGFEKCEKLIKRLREDDTVVDYDRVNKNDRWECSKCGSSNNIYDEVCAGPQCRRWRPFDLPRTLI